MIWDKIKAALLSPFTWIASFWTAFVAFVGNFIKSIATTAFEWVNELFLDTVAFPSDIQFLSWFADYLSLDTLATVFTNLLAAYVAAKTARLLIFPIRILLDVV